MLTATQLDFTATEEWQDLAADIPEAASVPLTLQNLDDSLVQVVFGGAAEPAGMTGTVLRSLDSIDGAAAHVWVRARRGAARVAVTLAEGLSQFTLISAASVNANVVKNGPGRVHGYSISNTNAAARYVKLYNKAAAPTQLDTPVRRICIPSGRTVEYSAPAGLEGFDAGIALRATTGVLDDDVGAVALADLVISIDYR